MMFEEENGVDVDTDNGGEKKFPESRKWMLTCNNPQDHGWDYDKLVDILKGWKAVKYWCIGYEVGVEHKRPHFHIFIYGTSPISAKTIHNKMPGINRKIRHATILENRDYVWKVGAWLGTEKEQNHDHSLDAESGDPPEEKGRGFRADLDSMYTLIKDGKSTYEILEENPQYIDKIEKIDKVRQILREEQYKNVFRKLDVTYIWGVTGTGKTRGVLDKYGYTNVYRVTDYMHPFDNYKGQDVIMFEEFRSDLLLGDMLKYLDGYPLELPSRYNNKVACFTKVYIVTNIDIRDQYPNVQKNETESWRAFLRRVQKIRYYNENGFIEKDLDEYIREDWHFVKTSPFDKGVSA